MNPFSRRPSPPTRAHVYGAIRQPSAAKTPNPHGRAKVIFLAIGSLLAVTVAAGWNPPTGSVHSFTTASDYRVERDSGCTNSGEGCHGKESSYSDFNDYHPNAKCTTCHDYQGVGCIPCHAPREHECALCHDGSMKNAPDRVRITDPYPRGHYRETTHTAMSTNMDEYVFALEGGEAKASCAQCHSRDLKKAHTAVPTVEGSTYGADIGCGECHNDVRAFGQAEVVSDWKKRSCDSCHKVGSSSPMHGSKRLAAVKANDDMGCSESGVGCHASADLHVIHADRPTSCFGSAKKGEPSCHVQGAEAQRPTAKGCGGTDDKNCHTSDDESGYRHKNESKAHALQGTASARRAFAGAACADCHVMAGGRDSLIAEHERATAAMSGSGDVCERCHNNEAATQAIENDWSGRSGSRACEACHDGTGIDAVHSDDLGASHIGKDSAGCASSGSGCHDGAQLASFGTAVGIHRACSDCHSPSTVPAGLSCGAGRACHGDGRAYDPKTSVHGRGTAAEVNGRDSLHRAGFTQARTKLIDTATGAAVACSVCHLNTLGAEHARPNNTISSSPCLGCHNHSPAISRVVKSRWPARSTASACESCHEGTALARPHAALDEVHGATERDANGRASAGTCANAGCHSSADVRVVHRSLGCAFEGCHSQSGDIRGANVLSCGGREGQDSCHAGIGQHAGAATHVATELDAYGDATPGTCAKAGCHSSADVRTIHTAKGCAISGCHADSKPNVMTCGGPEGQAGSCHVGATRHVDRDAKHQAVELDSFGEQAPGTCATPGCHAAADVRTIHAVTGCETPGCHTAQGPTYMTCGGSNGQAGACHATSRHENRDAAHQATEYDPSGHVTSGACARSGCHRTVDVRALHSSTYCETSGCHTAGGPTYMSCGGTGEQQNCHVTLSETSHPQDHSAALVGAIGGVNYGQGENVGCLGVCHDENLVEEHRIRLIGGSVDGSASGVCSVCHSAVADSGQFSTAAAVRTAISVGDRRCIACHANSTRNDDQTAVGAPAAGCVAAPPALGSVEEATTASVGTRARRPVSNEHGAVLPAKAGTESSEASQTPKTPTLHVPQESDDTDVSEPNKDNCSRTSTEASDSPKPRPSTGNGTCRDCHEVREPRLETRSADGEAD